MRADKILLAFWLTGSSLCFTFDALASQQKPTIISLRGGVLDAPPFSTVEVFPEGGGVAVYGGFQIDLLEKMKAFAKKDGIDLHVNLSPVVVHDEKRDQYAEAFDLVANDCNTTKNKKPKEDCEKFDFVVGNYYVTPERFALVDFTPAWLNSYISTIKVRPIHKMGTDYATLAEANSWFATICVKGNSYVPRVLRTQFPNMNVRLCYRVDDCITDLKQELCSFYADDILQLLYEAKKDPTLVVTREEFSTQNIVWPLRDSIDPVTSYYLKRWIYNGITDGTMDGLVRKYFHRKLCPIGTAGVHCELPCDIDYGRADADGSCICKSMKWTGSDCSTEVEEDVNAIPDVLKGISFLMVGINCSVVAICSVWLLMRRNTPQVMVSQPIFLSLVLLGCVISTLTIVALLQEDKGDGPVPACMAIPWLYCVGFSISFGTLFAKIRRIYVLFSSAATMQRTTVTTNETLTVIAAVLMADVTVLIVWTVIDPLQWSRDVLMTDQYGEPLSSQGYCYSEHWEIFGGCIGCMHFILLLAGCYLCYISRHIPSTFSEGKFVAIAIVSHLQIFVVGVPVLVLVGPDPAIATLVRSAIIWMNDLVVVVLIFGNLMYNVYCSTTQCGHTDSIHSQSLRGHSQSQQRGEGSGLNSISNHSHSAGTKTITENSMISEAIREYSNRKRKDSVNKSVTSPTSSQARFNKARLRNKAKLRNRPRFGGGKRFKQNTYNQNLRLASFVRRKREDDLLNVNRSIGPLAEESRAGSTFESSKRSILSKMDLTASEYFEAKVSTFSAVEQASSEYLADSDDDQSMSSETSPARPLRRANSLGSVLLPSEMESSLFFHEDVASPLKCPPSRRVIPGSQRRAASQPSLMASLTERSVLEQTEFAV